MKTLTLLRELFGKFPRLFVANIALLFVTSALESLILLTLVPVMDAVSKPDLAGAGAVTRHFLAGMRAVGIRPSLGHLLVALLAFQAVASAFSVLSNHSTLHTKYAVIREVLVGSFQDFFGARWYFFSSNSQGTLLSTFTRAVMQVGDAFGGLAYLFVVSARLVFMIAVPLTISWQITLLGTALAAVLVWPFMRLGRMSYRLGQVNNVTGNEIMSMLSESLSGAKVILGFGNERKSAEALRTSFNAHYRATIRFQTLSYAVAAGYKPLGLGVMAVTLFAARRLGVPLSEIAVLMISFLQIVSLVGQLAANKNIVQNLLPGYEQVKALRQEARRLEQRSGARTFSSFDRELVLEGVSFSYPDRAPILKEVSVRIPKGRFVAVVGESGVGKSTLVDLLMALHEPSAGRILIDGVPLQEFDVQSYRHAIGYVPQESVLFNRSIRENLLWAREDATLEDIRSACRQANAAEFIERLPAGYETVVGDRGVRLSGGQAQRVSLARAILRKPAFLILDEATSALDTHSERLVQQAVEAIARETTVIAIAHRLSTIMNAGHIVLLQDGRVAEEGTYQDLVHRDGLFQRMVQLQTLRAEA